MEELDELTRDDVQPELDFCEPGDTTNVWWDYGLMMRAERRGVVPEDWVSWPDITHFASEAERVAHHNNRDRRGGTLKTEEWLRLCAAFGGRCAYCGEPRKKLVLEHVRPLSLGGRTHVENVLPSCFRCNASKGATPLHEWRTGTGWWLEFIGRLVSASARYDPEMG